MNSAKQSQAVSNWTNGAISGNAHYHSPYSGQIYNVPYTHNVYHINPYGYAVPGYSPYHQNIYPR